MTFLFSLLGHLIPSASAQTLRNAGAGGAGVSDMWANICGILPCITGTAPGGSGLIDTLALAVIRFIFPLTSVVAVIMVMYAGIKIVTSDGSDDKISEAKKTIMYAVAGVILSLMATAIITFVRYYLSMVLR